MAQKYSFLVIKYPWPDTADDALAALKELSNEKVVKLKDAVAIRKTEKGKIKLHQTKDDSTGKGFIKGGAIGVLFAALFGPVGWIAMGVAAGGLFATFDRGIKNKLLKELGENMTPMESAVAILVEHADWATAVERMKAHGFGGTLVVSEIVEEDEAEVDRLLADPKKVDEVPEELEIAVAVAAVADEVEAPVGEVAEEGPAEAVAAAEAPEAPEEPRAAGQMRIDEVEGIGAVYAEKLALVGVKTTDDLLAAGATPAGREKIADESGISEKLVHDWVRKVDLMRIPGVGPQYSDLLDAAGVASPAELALRNPTNLGITFQEIVAARPTIVRRVPSESVIAGWIEEAGKLDRVVGH
jgi:uncharacterized membrane protein/predicted flap endonuclease-1-like 5' DNA nuclease